MSNWWENPRLADPETRRQDWEAGGRYDPTGSGGAPSAPSTPAAPSGGGDNGGGGGQTAPPAPTWDTEKDKPTDSGYTVAQLFALQYPYGDIRKIWEQQNAAAGAPPAPPPAPQNLAPAAPTWRGVAPHTTAPPAMGAQAPIAPTSTQPQGPGTIWGVDSKAGTTAGASTAPQAASGGLTRKGIDPISNTVMDLTEEQWAAREAKYNELADQKKAQQEFENRLKSDEAERARVAQLANEAYQRELIRTKDAELAQAAADAAIRAEIQRQGIEIQRQQNAIAQSNAVTNAAYQTGVIQNQAAANANNQSALQQARRQRRPYRAVRVSVR